MQTQMTALNAFSCWKFFIFLRRFSRIIEMCKSCETGFITRSTIGVQLFDSRRAVNSTRAPSVKIQSRQKFQKQRPKPISIFIVVFCFDSEIQTLHRKSRRSESNSFSSAQKKNQLNEKKGEIWQLFFRWFVRKRSEKHTSTMAIIISMSNGIKTHSQSAR